MRFRHLLTDLAGERLVPVVVAAAVVRAQPGFAGFALRRGRVFPGRSRGGSCPTVPPTSPPTLPLVSNIFCSLKDFLSLSAAERGMQRPKVASGIPLDGSQESSTNTHS